MAYSPEQCEQIKEMLRRHTEKMTREPGAKERCLASLIADGIYNPDGSLHENYGGQTTTG